MQLQVALDDITPGRGIQVITEVGEYADIVEMGTGFADERLSPYRRI